ncbi:hypothetical protein [Streptomyces sp. NPDC102487]
MTDTAVITTVAASYALLAAGIKCRLDYLSRHRPARHRKGTR